MLCRSLVLASLLVASSAHAQSPDRGAARPSRLSLGFAVDTSAVPASWWGVDAALAARPAVVRLWRDYLAVRGDSAKRQAFWSSADRRGERDPDLALASDGHILDVNAVLVEALPYTAGDSSRWVLRTMYIVESTAAQPGLLAMERMHVVREKGRWLLTHPSLLETAAWRRARIGRLEYVLHPDVQLDSARATETARWLDATAARFGIVDPAPVTYFQLPDLQAALRVTGFDWALSTDRVGGRAYPGARVVLAADPRFAESYRHEIAHVLLAQRLGRTSAFAGEGIAYWLGGARGQAFPEMMRDFATHLGKRPTLDLRTLLDAEQPAEIISAQLPAAAAVFELAQRRGGDRALQRLIDATPRRGMPTVASLAAALHLTSQELEQQWRAVVMSYTNATTQP